MQLQNRQVNTFGGTIYFAVDGTYADSLKHLRSLPIYIYKDKASLKNVPNLEGLFSKLFLSLSPLGVFWLPSFSPFSGLMDLKRYYAKIYILFIYYLLIEFSTIYILQRLVTQKYMHGSTQTNYVW